ncbi:uncharacterized membrane protein YozB (DUF420 family) [Methylobacterium sp. BE186]|uniref:hypothetical protein n=1 Tax=Methylobacterium sp. BE186 TaxID=2817715 RepID=UPI00285441C4|nr:hypothetical protein [Methylobacterium sp. BE186]MDR7040378.1 uncharacterized membrane protein YozB (DUF420 family) [Methylobacterium sp. BE186]
MGWTDSIVMSANAVLLLAAILLLAAVGHLYPKPQQAHRRVILAVALGLMAALLLLLYYGRL